MSNQSGVSYPVNGGSNDPHGHAYSVSGYPYYPEAQVEDAPLTHSPQQLGSDAHTDDQADGCSSARPSLPSLRSIDIGAHLGPPLFNINAPPSQSHSMVVESHNHDDRNALLTRRASLPTSSSAHPLPTEARESAPSTELRKQQWKESKRKSRARQKGLYRTYRVKSIEQIDTLIDKEDDTATQETNEAPSYDTNLQYTTSANDNFQYGTSDLDWGQPSGYQGTGETPHYHEYQ